MNRLLTHLVLTGALVAAPVLRVLCYGSCAPDVSPQAETVVASDATAACHEHDESQHATPKPDSAPLEDDCTHGGDSSSSGLKASVKVAGGDGPRAPLAATVPSTHLPVVSSEVRGDPPPVFHAGQFLGLFLTPLRI